MQVCDTGDSLTAVRVSVWDFLHRCMPTSRWSLNLCSQFNLDCFKLEVGTVFN